MLHYTAVQWLFFFYFYCFFGWIFESSYVSLKEGHFVNRGFLRLPMLPLYGTGAVMMLWVSLPVRDNLVLVYISGVVAATVLEYVTGWSMERLFKMKYWDYSNYPLNLAGYVCVFSAVGFGAFGVIWFKWAGPFLIRTWERTAFSVQILIIGLADLVFVTDLVFSLLQPHSGEFVTFSFLIL